MSLAVLIAAVLLGGTGYLVIRLRRNLTERRRYEERLRLQVVALDAAANAIVITDRCGVIQWVNPAFTTLTGYARDEVIGKQPRLLKSGAHDPAYYEDMWRTILSGQVWTGETINRHRNGHLYTEEQTITPVRDGRGAVTHFIAIKQDATARKEAEHLRASLVRTMVHDLRNPLTLIHGTLAILRGEEGSHGPDTTAWALEHLDKAVQKMVDLVNAILECEQLKSGEVPIERGRVEVAELIDDALRLEAPLAKRKRQELRGECPEGLPPVEADRRLIDRVMQNLVGNAIKFTPAGGSVCLTAARDNDRVVISVSDTGPGIPAELRGRLFGEFVTGPQENSGNGLGLAFCRLAITAHGGRAWVDSEPGQGARFSFSLPVAEERPS